MAPLLLWLLACDGEPVDTGTAPDPDALEESETLEPPPLSDAEVEALVSDAIAIAIDVGPQAAWVGMEPSLARGEVGCPDIYIGDAPSGLATQIGGWSWEDSCVTSEGVRFDGAVWWKTEAGRGGDDANYVTSVERAWVGDVAVTQAGSDLYVVSGDWADTLSETVTGSKEEFDYSGSFDMSASGLDAFADGATPGGWRAVGLTGARGGGSLDEVDLEEDIYFFTPVLGGAVDAISTALRWSFSENETSGCTLEPYGWVSLRTVDGLWIDVPFVNEGDANGSGQATDGGALCDGCATWYARGVEQGQICPDLGFIWDGRLEPPVLTDMLLVPRMVGAAP